MRAEVVARNYAETLLALADRHGGRATAEEFQAALDSLATLLETEPRIREFLDTPRIAMEEKKQVLISALQGRVPDLFLRFAAVVVEKRRQGLFREIALSYRDLLDQAIGRARVSVALSHAPDPALQDEIRLGLEARLGRTVIPTFTVDPDLLGGIVVRLGDEILDGSLRNQAAGLRRRLLAVDLPAGAPLAAD